MVGRQNSAFNDLVVTITGASGGLGREMAAGFVSAGATVICSSRNEGSLERSVNELPDEPGNCDWIPADVRSERDVRDLIEAVEETYGRIDVFINNAGVSEVGLTGGEQPSISDIPVDLWDRILETNLRGVFLCTRAVLPGMLDRDSGQLIHLSSGMGVEGRANRAAYVSSKFGLEGFHQSLACELMETGVSSVILDPGGGVNTDGFSEHLNEGDRSKRLDPGIIVEPALRLAAGEGENGARYVATRMTDS